MIWLVYYFVLRLLSPVALAGFYVLNTMTRAKRSRALILAPDGQVLLVMNALGDRRWTLPGGGMKRGESPEVAAAREIAEELHLPLEVERFQLLGEVPSGSYRAPIALVRLHAEELPRVRADKFEIYAYRWCDASNLPAPLQPLVHSALGLLSAQSELATME